MVVKKPLEGILEENGLSRAHLSPHVARHYQLSSLVNYVQPIDSPKPKVKGGMSEAEKKIRDYFERNGIAYEYERKLVVEEDDKIHIRSPDFYLPKYGLYIEYNGMEGNDEDDRRYEKKMAFYENNEVKHMIIHRHEMESGRWISKLEKMTKNRRTQSYAPLAAAAACGLLLLYLL